MLLEKNDEQQDYRNETAERCGYRRSFHSECRHAEFTEDEGVVAYDVQYIDNQGYIHRVFCLVGAS